MRWGPADAISAHVILVISGRGCRSSSRLLLLLLAPLLHDVLEANDSLCTTE